MSSLNVGNIDRSIRILIGLALIVIAATNNKANRGWLGIYPLATGAIAY